MASVKDIYNMALYEIGSSQVLDATTDITAEASVCNAFYAQVRDQILQDFPWGFATRVVSLASLAATVAENDGFPYDFTYKYAYPSDCLFIREIISPLSRQPNATQKVSFKVLYDGSAKAIYTDTEDAKIAYTARITDTTKYDPLFIQALTYMLALKIATPLSKSKESERLRGAYVQAVHAAFARSASEGFNYQPESEIMLGRL